MTHTIKVFSLLHLISKENSRILLKVNFISLYEDVTCLKKGSLHYRKDTFHSFFKALELFKNIENI